MRSNQGSVTRYSPAQVPDKTDDLIRFLRDELVKLQGVLGAIADGQLDLTTVAPTKPRSGMIRYGAAGVFGVGEGFYGYYAGAWHFLG